MKCVCRFGIKGKIAPGYIGLYPILEKYGPLASRVELPSRLSGVLNVFHISQLKRCLKPPINVLDQQDRATRKKIIWFYKVQWNDHSEDEATWEREDYLRSNYPNFLPSR
jgi:hypothetical protein